MLIINRHERNCLAMPSNATKVLQLLGLARRAGALITGEEMVLKAVRNHKAHLVLIASDTGKSTFKKITDKASFYNVAVIADYDRATLSDATGMARSIYAINNAGFAKKIKEVNNTEKGE
ncbi:ribosomal L7Ae/L30e/S12e/Gadd45 family protein [Periweissella ghanensis]|nr:ribosomal L7Ae/L30e/S12e/Gadd45 family protein [Periweissella ghanensis]